MNQSTIKIDVLLDPNKVPEQINWVASDSTAHPTTEELDNTCLAHIARFKRPKEYRFVPALPTNNYGKVLKRELRQRLVQPEA